MDRWASTLVVSTAILLLCALTSSAFADGMPLKESKPQPILIPIDKSLQEVQNPSKEVPSKEQPVNIVPPVPESRVVEVQPDSSFFGLSVGMYDPFTHGKTSTAFNLEWQSNTKIAGILQPIFGGMATTQGSLLGYGGLGI
ncbi:MAG: hypothetical protein HY052_08205, partial [Proteobacteria bacterium]|nr:hypothetical protein [Pseudomonadota bacterium]